MILETNKDSLNILAQLEVFKSWNTCSRILKYLYYPCVLLFGLGYHHPGFFHFGGFLSKKFEFSQNSQKLDFEAFYSNNLDSSMISLLNLNSVYLNSIFVIQ